MYVLCLALFAYWIVLLVRVILSWVSMAWSPPSGLTPLIRIVYDLTEPVLGLFRRYIPPVGGLDLSPLIVFLIIGFARRQLGCY
jgi:YggT family protein